LTSPTNKNQLLSTAIQAAIEAGQAIMSVYDTDFEVDYKDDQSPLTIADTKANAVIESHLVETGLPILSEESRQIPYPERKNWQRFWMVDPLDGTKEFIKRNDEFTVNIALIEGQSATMGVVYLPVTNILYFGSMIMGGYKLGNRACTSLFSEIGNNTLDLESLITCAERLPLPGQGRPLKDAITIVGSRSHGGPELEDYVSRLKEQYRKVHYKPAGSSLKICLVAEGSADQYPRLGPTMEWDTAAGHAVAAAAGATVTEYPSGKSLSYNKENLLNPWFVVSRHIDRQQIHH
jgi:3'(2'), 5'-bisphosphate nucleotidase